MQPLFNLAHEPHGDDDRDDVALIAHQRDGIQPAEHRLVGLHALGRNGPGVLQVGVDHDHADDRAQERVAAEDFRGGEGNEDGQESVRRVGEQLGEHVEGAGSIDVDEAVVDHEVQRFHDAHQEAGGHDGGDDGHEDVAQCLDGLLVPRGFGCGCLLDFLFGSSADAGQSGELIVDFVYRAGAEDDLQLTLGLKDALGPLGVLEGLFVHLVVVRNDQAQAGCAVGCRYDVGRAADGIQYLLCRVFVIHENRSFYKM